MFFNGKVVGTEESSGGVKTEDRGEEELCSNINEIMPFGKILWLSV
jgi:hypothetical protein